MEIARGSPPAPPVRIHEPLALSHRKATQMLQTITALGLLLLGFIAADWIQLNGAGWILGAIYLATALPLFIIELIRSRR